ncbi:uncharacterized protein FMAN_05373 [Fusarium mangiferae]|uniref:Zn(2)-C6 fungal-type domain-containing protein n=1 Tax=Fusarium mangiferae TaxID=192010 RepID=A0A1L7SMH0_FUSMA|nr:uncharacterized protein FMAN_05373 [Fusarium mangiferae]CVK87760.1 uncharacterized protein FMAN_05373 [Fusarium mangiferae]
MDPGRKRIGSIAESATSSNQRSKRAKYAPVACNECKKKKLKCVREEGDEICKRCDVNKVECIFAPTVQPAKEDAEPARRRSTQEPQSQTDVGSLSQQVIALQNQVNALTSALQDVSQRLPHITLSSTKSTPQGHSSTYRKDIRNVHNEPREPQFVGPTRSAYSFQIAENSLTGMGIEPNATGASTPAESPSETEPVVESENLSPGIEDVETLASLGIAEVQRLLDVYNEEIQSVYPFIDVNELSNKAVSVFQTPMENTLKDVQAIKLAVATSVAIEAQGLNNISKRLIDDVEPVICRVSGEAFIDLQELQLMIMLSIYWFHCGEDLLAWRAIGNAGRESLEIGLHRRTSLFENFKTPPERDLAIRCFWCVYILDRRWSYGTSLSFGISDRDIDPQCPEPVWEDLPLDSSPFTVPKDKVDFFDFLTQKWVHSIPEDLQLVYPRLSQAPRHQPRVLQRLRTLLYLRGNYIRNLVLRHHVMSAENLRSDMQGAQLVVSLAQDTIQVLVNLNETSDIYARQKATFNYFLTGALATILLAVCHGPDVFADRCRQSFQDAVRLLKNISQHGQLGRRLWRSLKGTIHRALSLESPITPTGNTALAEILQQETPEVRQQQTLVPTSWPRNVLGNNFMEENMADMFGLETDLLNLFSAFEQDNMLRPVSQVNGLDQAAALPDQNGGVGQGDDLTRFNGGF